MDTKTAKYFPLRNGFLSRPVTRFTVDFFPTVRTGNAPVRHAAEQVHPCLTPVEAPPPPASPTVD